jgi:hypothetical protein
MELAHVGRVTVFTQKYCNLFILFKDCLGRIHENGHLCSTVLATITRETVLEEGTTFKAFYDLCMILTSARHW